MTTGASGAGTLFGAGSGLDQVTDFLLAVLDKFNLNSSSVAGWNSTSRQSVDNVNVVLTGSRCSSAAQAAVTAADTLTRVH